MMQYKTPDGKVDYYGVLGLVPGAGIKEIKAGYEKKRHELYSMRPDTPENRGLVKLVNEAAHTLINPQLRREYDEAMVSKRKYTLEAIKVAVRRISSVIPFTELYKLRNDDLRISKANQMMGTSASEEYRKDLKRRTLLAAQYMMEKLERFGISYDKFHELAALLGQVVDASRSHNLKLSDLEAMATQ